MPVYTIPDHSGPFAVAKGSDGSFGVVGAKRTGPAAVFIPCRDEAQAEAVRERLNAGGHDGTIRVDLFRLPDPDTP